MEAPGQKLKKARELLALRFKDVEAASEVIAQRKSNDGYKVFASRLHDIENGVDKVPTMHRLYSLCAIYRIDYLEALEWYGIKLSELAADSGQIRHEQTHQIKLTSAQHGEATVPISLNPGVDPSRTTYLSQVVQRWGTLPLATWEGYEPRQHRYAWIGTQDWTMYPTLRPGALVIINETRRKIRADAWPTEAERPIHLLEDREGRHLCGWCSLAGNQLIVQPNNPRSQPRIFQYPMDVEVIGQVVGVAMTLDGPAPDRSRS